MSNTLESKKIFFVKPNSVIQKELIAVLIQKEYEAYLVPDIERAKVLFEQFPDCLAFLNIDEGPSENEWETFVIEVQRDPRFRGVKLGILTYNSDPELAKKYLLEHQLPCGFIKLSLGLAESTQIVLQVLRANEALGRRKYLRVKCAENTKLNFKSPTGTVEGQILDLSVVGMTCTLNPDKAWPQNAVIEQIQLQLKGSLCLLTGIIFGSRRWAGGGRLYIVLFDPKTPETQREKIRAYMQWVLQSKVDAVTKLGESNKEFSR